MKRNVQKLLTEGEVAKRKAEAVVSRIEVLMYAGLPVPAELLAEMDELQECFVAKVAQVNEAIGIGPDEWRQLGGRPCP